MHTLLCKFALSREFRGSCTGYRSDTSSNADLERFLDLQVLPPGDVRSISSSSRRTHDLESAKGSVRRPDGAFT